MIDFHSKRHKNTLIFLTRFVRGIDNEKKKNISILVGVINCLSQCSVELVTIMILESRIQILTIL